MKILKNYLKDPLSTIAVNTTIFIFGCIIFGLFVVTMIILDVTTTENPIRTEHLQQHTDDHLKYDKIIQILDSIDAKLVE